MANSPFLDKTGLSHLWAGIKDLLAGKADIDHEHQEATTSAAGLMSASDKAKLEAISGGVYDATVE